MHRWQDGERISSRKLNEPIDAINVLARGVRPPRQLLGQSTVTRSGRMWCYVSRIPGGQDWDGTTGVGPRYIPHYLFVRPLVLRPQPNFNNRLQYFISEKELYARIYPRGRATLDVLTFYQSLIVAPGFWSGIPSADLDKLPRQLAAAPDLGDGALWEVI
jgi:hypothetical protein